MGVLTGEPVVVLDLSDQDEELLRLPPSRPAVVIGVHRGTARHPPPTDVDIALTSSRIPEHVSGWVSVADPVSAAERLSTRIASAPEAAIVCCQVLRSTEGIDVTSALLVESFAYSTLQSGPEFSRWLATATRPTVRADSAPTVLVQREANTLTITLNRPASRNAFNARMRAELVDALSVARHDESVVSIHLKGAGNAFSSGGDLSEFGTLVDPATAHLVRTTQSPARLLSEVAARATVHLQGSCVGAGVEFAAFCHRVVADSDATLRLPELEFGLIPGAGGTVSIPRRIGRHRSTWLALSGENLDAGTALEWGLVDVLAEP